MHIPQTRARRARIHPPTDIYMIRLMAVFIQNRWISHKMYTMYTMLKETTNKQTRCQSTMESGQFVSEKVKGAYIYIYMGFTKSKLNANQQTTK